MVRYEILRAAMMDNGTQFIDKNFNKILED